MIILNSFFYYYILIENHLPSSWTSIGLFCSNLVYLDVFILFSFDKSLKYSLTFINVFSSLDVVSEVSLIWLELETKSWLDWLLSINDLTLSCCWFLLLTSLSFCSLWADSFCWWFTLFALTAGCFESEESLFSSNSSFPLKT